LKGEETMATTKGYTKDLADNGDVVVKYPNGKKVETYTESIEEIAYLAIDRIQSFADMLLESGQHEPVGYVLEGMCRDSKERIDKAAKFIHENLGEVAIN
jgi:hypothetical protein